MKRTILTVLVTMLAASAAADRWTCVVPYDEINGGGSLILDEDRLVFSSNWPHRDPEEAACIAGAGKSECLSARLSPTRNGGAAAMMKLFSVTRTPDGLPVSVTVREPNAIFRAEGDGYRMYRALPSAGYSFELTDCVAG